MKLVNGSKGALDPQKKSIESWRVQSEAVAVCVHRWNAPRAELVCYHLQTIVPNRDLGGNDGPEEGRAYITGSVDGELLRGSE